MRLRYCQQQHVVLFKIREKHIVADSKACLDRKKGRRRTRGTNFVRGMVSMEATALEALYLSAALYLRSASPRSSASAADRRDR
jgi:hypothetical protein